MRKSVVSESDHSLQARLRRGDKEAFQELQRRMREADYDLAAVEEWADQGFVSVPGAPGRAQKYLFRVEQIKKVYGGHLEKERKREGKADGVVAQPRRRTQRGPRSAVVRHEQPDVAGSGPAVVPGVHEQG